MGEDSTLELTPEQSAETRLVDGIATDGDIELLGDVDVSAAVSLRDDLRWALSHADAPSVASQVMARIGYVGADVGDVVRGEAGLENAVVESVMGRLGIDEQVGSQLRGALVQEAGSAPSLWADIAPSVGAEAPMSLGDMLRGAVTEEVGKDFVPSPWFAPQRNRWAMGAAAGAVFAAAAALLLYVGLAGGGDQVAEATMGPLLEAPVDIEELDAGDNQAVQVLQFGSEAPTIILIEDIDGEAP